MGSQQQFCLRWNNHQVNMLGVFDQLLQTEALVDVTIACEGLSLKAHKVVLSACSPFFQSLFLDNPCKHPIVILKDVKYSDLKALVDFMYRGEVNVSQEHLSALLQTAETLKVKGLAEVTGGMGETPGESDSRNDANAVQQGPAQDDLGPSQSSMMDDGKQSPPSKRKKMRSRRRSGGSSNQSDREDDEMHIPSEVVETKVEIMDDDDDGHREPSMDSIPTSINQTFQHVDSKAAISTVPPSTQQQQADSDIVLNRSYGSSAGLEVLSCPSTSNAASTLNRNVHLAPPSLISTQTSVPVLSVPSLPSTSGNQSSSQDMWVQATSVCGLRNRRPMLYDPVNLQMALATVASGEMGFCKAAKKFGVNHATLWRHYNYSGLPSRRKRNGKSIPQIQPCNNATLQDSKPSVFRTCH